MRLISKRGSAMDAELVKTAPPGHHAFYWDLAREGLIVGAEGGVSVVIPFSKVKRIELDWLE